MLYRRPAAEWISIINSAGVPCGPVLDLGQALAHPTTVALGVVQNVKHPTLGDMKVLGQAVKINGDDPDWLRRHPPLLGEHTEEVLRELGYSLDDITTLTDSGTVRARDTFAMEQRP